MIDYHQDQMNDFGGFPTWILGLVAIGVVGIGAGVDAGVGSDAGVGVFGLAVFVGTGLGFVVGVV